MYILILVGTDKKHIHIYKHKYQTHTIPVHVYLYTGKHSCIHTYTHAGTHSCKHAYLDTHTIRKYTQTCRRTYTCTYVYMHPSIHTYRDMQFWLGARFSFPTILLKQCILAPLSHLGCKWLCSPCYTSIPPLTPLYSLTRGPTICRLLRFVLNGKFPMVL